jgi:hypothetical protein
MSPTRERTFGLDVQCTSFWWARSIVSICRAFMMANTTQHDLPKTRESLSVCISPPLSLLHDVCAVTATWRNVCCKDWKLEQITGSLLDGLCPHSENVSTDNLRRSTQYHISTYIKLKKITLVISTQTLISSSKHVLHKLHPTQPLSPLCLPCKKLKLTDTSRSSITEPYSNVRASQVLRVYSVPVLLPPHLGPLLAEPLPAAATTAQEQEFS